MSLLTIAQLTIRETQRRRILWVALALGAAFVGIFALGFHYIYREFETSGSPSSEGTLAIGLMLTAGLYATNFLIVVISVITSVTAVSGEIETHTIEAMLTKPIRRWELLLGKWVGYAVMLLVYILLLSGSILLFVYWRAGFMVQNLLSGLSLMVLQGVLMLSVSIAGGTRLSSLANGVLAFMLYSLAFIGGWVEQIGSLLRNETAVDIGIATSLLMPSEILWKRALALLQPDFTNTPGMAGPFSVVSQPSNLMIVYAVIYTAVVISLAMWSFQTRDF